MRRHLTYANVVATMALLLALGGGTAYAATLVTSKDIKNGTIQTKDLSKTARRSLHGATGTTGARGAVGAAGATGAAGAAGPAGPKGDAGAKGDTGVKGDAGAPALLKRTTLTSGVNNDYAPTGAAASVLTVGTFTKSQAGSVVDLTWSSNLGITPTNTTNTALCTWQVRIDGKAPDQAGQVVDLAGVGTTLPTFTQSELTETFSALAAGTHTVSLWLSGGGTTKCLLNTGGFTDVYSVKESAL